MRWSFSIGRIAGTDVKVHLTFLLLPAYWAWIGYQENGPTGAVIRTLFILGLFVCVLLHEFGHILMARRFGVRTPDVILLPIGGVARLERLPSEPKQEFLIALAGPAVTLLLAVLLFLGIVASGGSPGFRDPELFDVPFFTQLFWANVILLIFNLIPAFPMDGGRILRALLASRMGLVRGTRTAAALGQMLAVAGGLYGLTASAPILVLIAFFVFIGASAEAQAVETRVAGEGLQAFAEAEQAWNLITDLDAFDAYLRSVPYTRRGDVIAKLGTYEQDFKVEHAVPGTAVLLNLIPDVPEDGSGMFRIEPNIVVGRITLRLLRAAGDAAALAEAVRQILPQLNTLSAKFELITHIGYRENAGHRLVSEADAKEFERRDEVRAATPDQLAAEWDLARVLYFANADRADDESPTVVPDEPDVTLAILRSARTETRSQTVGDRAVRRASRLPWDMLVAI